MPVPMANWLAARWIDAFATRWERAGSSGGFRLSGRIFEEGASL